MLKVFGAARHAQPTGYPHSLSRYRLNNSFGHALWIDTSTGRKVEILDVGRHLQRTYNLRYCSNNPSDMHFESAQRRKDIRGRVGCAEAMEDEGVFFETFVFFPLLA